MPKTPARPVPAPSKAASGSLIVTMEPVARVKPYSGNPRKNEAAVAKVVASIREFGFRQPLVVDEKFVLIVGHTRLLAARELGLELVPVHVAKGLPPAKVRAYRLADNRTAEEADWDPDALKIELGALEGDGFDLSLTGFDDDELAKLLHGGDSEEGGGPQLGDVEYQVIVTCASEQEQAKLCARLEKEGRSCRLLTL